MATVRDSSAQTLEQKGWHGLVVRLGRWRSVLLLTAFSVLASVLLTGIGMQLLDVPPRGLWQGYVLAVLVPAIVAPLATYAITGLVLQLDAARGALHQLAIHDSLTQAYNRRHFLEQLPLEVVRAQRSGQPLSLLMLDADHFKLVNDQHGHATGDEVLRALAGRCRALLRPYDLLVRYGVRSSCCCSSASASFQRATSRSVCARPSRRPRSSRPAARPCT